MTKIKIEFAEGCFDDFEGTQEELDEIIAVIGKMAESGELLMDSMPLSEEEEKEILECLEKKTARH